MPNEIEEKLDETVIRKHLSDVTAKSTAWIFLQEPGFIGFGVVGQDKIFWPPYPDRPRDWTPDWKRISDLRLFSEKGEWHVWRDWDGKHYARLLKLHKLNDDNSLTEYHFLWGTKKVESDTPPWIKLTEDRGTEIWLPLQGQVTDSEKNSDLPLRLKLKQVVGYDPDYHLAGIIDAALVGLVRSSDKELLLPTDLPPCP